MMKKSLLRLWGTVGTILSLIGCHSIAGSTMEPEEFFTQPDVVDLARAAGRGDVQTIDRLVEEGVDVNSQGDKGMTALMWALYRQDHAGFEALLKHGANPNLHMVDGESVMSYAAAAPDVSFLRMTLEYGGDPNLRNPKNRLKPTPLFNAAEQGNLAAAKILVEAGTDIETQDVMGYDAASSAAGINQWHVALFLLEAGAPLIDNASSMLFDLKRHNIGYAPGDIAFEARLEVARLLREKGLPVVLKVPYGAPDNYNPNGGGR